MVEPRVERTKGDKIFIGVYFIFKLTYNLKDSIKKYQTLK